MSIIRTYLLPGPLAAGLLLLAPPPLRSPTFSPFLFPKPSSPVKGMGRPSGGGLAAIVGAEVFPDKLPLSLSSWMGVEELGR